MDESQKLDSSKKGLATDSDNGEKHILSTIPLKIFCEYI